MLSYKFQNGQQLLKWNQHVWIGQFLGFSDEHTSLVANVRIQGMDMLALNFVLSLMTSFKLFSALVKFTWCLMQLVIKCL